MKSVKEMLARCDRELACSQQDLTRVWNAMVHTVGEALDVGRGVILPDFGSIVFLVPSEREGTSAKKKGCVFLLSNKFAGQYGARSSKMGRSLLSPSRPLPLSKISALSGLSRDHAKDALAAIFDCIGRAVRRGADVRIGFGRVGTFACHARCISFRFKNGFARELTAMSGPTADIDKYVTQAVSALNPAAERKNRAVTARTAFREEEPPRSCRSAWSERRRAASAVGKAATAAAEAEAAEAPAVRREEGPLQDTSPGQGRSSRSSRRAPFENPEVDSTASSSDRGASGSRGLFPTCIPRLNHGCMALRPTKAAEATSVEAGKRFREKVTRHRQREEKILKEGRENLQMQWGKYADDQEQEQKKRIEILKTITEQAREQRLSRKKDEEDQKRDAANGGSFHPGVGTGNILEREARQRRAWCATLGSQVEARREHRRVEEGARKAAEAYMMSALDKEITVDRIREFKVAQEDRRFMAAAWKAQAAGAEEMREARREGMLDKVCS